MGLVGGGSVIKNPTDVYIDMLQSRTLADRLIQRFKLQKRYRSRTMTATRDSLRSQTRIEGAKDGLITIEFTDEDPKFAAEVANGYVEELILFSEGLAVTDASKRRLFFEVQLKRTKDQLADAEVELKKTEETTGMIHLENQTRADRKSVV